MTRRRGVWTGVAVGLILLACWIACPQARVISTPPAYDWPRLKSLWRARLRAVAERGQLPILDVESCFYQKGFSGPEVVREMDRYGVALIAMSPEFRRTDDPLCWQPQMRWLMEDDPTHFIPVPTGNLHTVVIMKKDVAGFLDDLFAAVLRDGYPMMGEYFFRHYISNMQFRAEQTEESLYNVSIPIDGPVARRVFAFSQEHDVPLQIHYEVEDVLLPPLERMLAQFPRARVIWCHFGRVRRLDRALHYGPSLIRRLLAQYPNLYFDTSCNGPDDRYLRYGHCSRIWNGQTRHLEAAWLRILEDFPDRFMSALDLGSDRSSGYHVGRTCQAQRRFLAELPLPLREKIACRTAWRFLFREDLPARLTE